MEDPNELGLTCGCLQGLGLQGIGALVAKTLFLGLSDRNPHEACVRRLSRLSDLKVTAHGKQEKLFMSWAQGECSCASTRIHVARPGYRWQPGRALRVLGRVSQALIRANRVETALQIGACFDPGHEPEPSANLCAGHPLADTSLRGKAAPGPPSSSSLDWAPDPSKA